MAFKFDVALLCDLMESRPCLWDKRNANYLNRVEKEKAWEEIFKYLDDEYEIKTAVEKKETRNNIFF